MALSDRLITLLLGAIGEPARVSELVAAINEASNVDLTADVFGILPVANGGTNITSYTVGDLLYATGATALAKLPKGTALQKLQMNASATAPEWVTLAAGGVTIGNAVSGGTPNYVLFVDASGNVGQSSDLQYNDSTNVFTLAGNQSMFGGANTRHMIWTTDGGGNIGVDTRSTSNLGDGMRPRNMFLSNGLIVGNLLGNTPPYGLNHTILPGIIFSGNLTNVGTSMGTSTLYTGGSTGAFLFHKTGSLVGSVGFANFDVVSDLDIYYCKLTAPGARVDYLKFGSDGTINFMQTTGADLKWNTDGAGSIGSSTANRPDGVNAKSTMSIGDGNYSTSQATVNTTDAALTTLQTTATTSNSTMLVEYRVTGLRTGGIAGAANDAAYYILKARIKNDAGTVTIYGPTAEESEDQAAWDADLFVSGTNVLLKVTGALNNNITWKTTTISQKG